MYIAFVKDYSKDRLQIAVNTIPSVVEAAILGMMTRYREQFAANASILAELEQLGSVKPQPPFQLGWMEFAKMGSDGSLLNTAAAMHQFKVGQIGQLYRNKGLLIFVGQEYVDVIKNIGLGDIVFVAKQMAEAGESYTSEDGKLSPLQIVCLAIAAQGVGMEPTEENWPKEYSTVDLDGVPSIMIPMSQMTMTALTEATMRDQANAQFAGRA